MRINIVLTGRSHMLQLAKQLQRNGHQVRFYTCIPKTRCERYGLDRRYVTSLFPFLGWLFLYRLIDNRRLREFILNLLDFCMDTIVSYIQGPCDIFIGASTVAIRSAKAARRRFNAKVICDCGTKHVRVQNDILEKIPNAHRINPSSMKRELKFYEFADLVVVPSEHSKRSFVDQGIDPSKMRVNPYGVDLTNFSPQKKTGQENYDIIITGAWRYIKGVDLLECVAKRKGLKVLHVGPIFEEVQFPSSPLFFHVDTVEEVNLPAYYARAKIFVLPSRAEGLALVLAQAVACGLPVVYSKDTGGEDISHLLSSPESGFMTEMSSFSIEALERAIDLALGAYHFQPMGDLRQYVSAEKLQNISWDAYGKRYSSFILS